MPYKIYDYHCSKCGVLVHDCMVRADFLDTDTEKDATKCPDCNWQMTRLIPAPPWKWANGSRGF